METVIHLPNNIRIPGMSGSIQEYQKRISDWELSLQPSLPEQQHESDVWVTLDREGTMTTTEGLCKWLKKRASSSTRTVRFLIGGKQGLPESYVRSSSWTLSVGPLVLNQSISALVIAEQMYRCFCLRTNHPYHG